MPRPKVRFVYRRSSRYLGSTVLRVDQLCRLSRRHPSERYDFAIPTLSASASAQP